MPTVSLSLGDLVRTRREAAGLSRLALAQRAGVSQPCVEFIERGIARDPRASTISGLARGLNVSTDTLLAPFTTSTSNP